MKHKYSHLLFSLILSLACISAVFAQTGTLKGVITDADSKEPLVGATVFIVGTYKGGAADIDGKFNITGIKPGDYTVKISYVGYTEKVYNGIKIEKDAEKVLNVTLREIGATSNTVEIIGERNMVDLESGKSEVRIAATDIKEMNVRNVQDIVSMQAGVSQSPDGLQIRGGRVYETVYMVDGISAQDPLAGTGFGVDVGSNSVADLTLVTGGSDAEFNGTSGVILTRVKEGGDKVQVSGSWQRDNLGYNTMVGPAWNTDLGSFAIGGPLAFTNKKVKFFVSGDIGMTDNYYKVTADQLSSSILPNAKFFAPRMDNKWSNTVKLSFQLTSKLRMSLLNQHSILINQNSRTLQIIGFNQIMQPGLQYGFINDFDNATTYTHRSNLSVANFHWSMPNNWVMNVDLGRLSTNLRADANGRPFRTETIDRIFDPSSIVTGTPRISQIRDLPFTLDNGLINNGGISGLWHDHYVTEYTVKYKFSHFSADRKHFVSFGQEHREQDMQWIDVNRPWVGAPIRLPDGTYTRSTSVGSSSDLWRVKPAQGRIFAQDEIKYKGVIATLGASFEYWAPGKTADNAVEGKNPYVSDATREDYKNQTFKFIDGRRYNARFLPRIRVSFPVTENNVLYFNYGHSMRLAHPRFVYAGLDTNYQNRAQSNIGNPAIKPEVCVAYEIGIKSQITKDLGVTLTAFYKDYFDYIITTTKQFNDGDRDFSINQDYARVRGLEAGMNYRFSRYFKTFFNVGYQVATGKSNSALEARQGIFRQNGSDLTKEQFLAWDRPFDAKVAFIFTPDSTFRIGPTSLKGFRFFVSSTAKSGLRYTPVVFSGNDIAGRPRYDQDISRPNDKIGSAWYWTDIRITKDFKLKGNVYVSLSIEMKNVFNNQNAQIINPVTGTAYNNGDGLLYTSRDPRYPSPQDAGLPPTNPARWMEPRHVLYGISFTF